VETGTVLAFEALLSQNFEAFLHICNLRVVQQEVISSFDLGHEFVPIILIPRLLLPVFALNLLIGLGLALLAAQLLHELLELLRQFFDFNPLPTTLLGHHLVTLLK
jgi:hypothetical protein